LQGRNCKTQEFRKQKGCTNGSFFIVETSLTQNILTLDIPTGKILILSLENDFAFSEDWKRFK
jgi:hypothetical protein